MKKLLQVEIENGTLKVGSQTKYIWSQGWVLLAVNRRWLLQKIAKCNFATEL